MNTLEILAIIINIVLIWLFIKGSREDSDWVAGVFIVEFVILILTIQYFLGEYIDILTTPLW